MGFYLHPDDYNSTMEKLNSFFDSHSVFHLENVSDFSVFTFFVVSGIVTVVIYLVSTCLISPLYHYVYRTNRARDEKSSVYAIVNHFYNLVTFMQSCTAGFIIFLIVALNLIKEPIFIIVTVSSLFLLIYFTFCILTTAQNLLLFFLAIQRFLLYYFPKSDKYLSPTRAKFKGIIKRIYIIITTLSVLLRFIKVKCYIDKMGYEGCTNTYDVIYMVFYTVTNFLVFLSSIFYFSILVSVRQFAKMSSQMKTRPEKYIFYQTVLIFFIKMISFICALIFIVGKNIQLEIIYFANVFIDIFTLPFVIQMSYLFCNQSNVKTLISIRFNDSKTWLIMCCGATPSERDRRRTRTTQPANPEQLNETEMNHIAIRKSDVKEEVINLKI